jgi:hypothetical protein
MNIAKAKCWGPTGQKTKSLVLKMSGVVMGLTYSVPWILTDCLACLGCLILITGSRGGKVW